MCVAARARPTARASKDMFISLLHSSSHQVTSSEFRSAWSNLWKHIPLLNNFETKNLQLLFVSCLSQQHAGVSQGRIFSNIFPYCPIEIQISDPTLYLTQSQYTDTWLTSPRADPKRQAPGTVATGVPNFKSLV